MTLGAGQTLTHYEILAPLGAGGMGEVYRARDTRLEREVAIKVLPEDLADDEERLRRFEREARTLASLNHTNVAGIHGVDQEGDVCFLALELVPGEDLATRLSRGPLAEEEAIDVCRQIAEGLEAAHVGRGAGGHLHEVAAGEGGGVERRRRLDDLVAELLEQGRGLGDRAGFGEIVAPTM